MKKIIINENWEEEIIEDNSNFFVLIFKQGSNAGYIKAFSPNNEEILDKYQELVSQYENTTFEVPTNILIIKVPATGQVKVMLDQALYTGEENNPEQVEILNHLLGRADCEYIGETNLGVLTEAKKKKKKRKKRKTPRVTYTTGWPWYNDHMFNHHNGTCDCNKDKDEAGEDAADNANDAISGGESVGDAGSAGGDFGGDFGGGDSAGGDGGAMGEGLTEAKEESLEDKIRSVIAHKETDDWHDGKAYLFEVSDASKESNNGEVDPFWIEKFDDGEVDFSELKVYDRTPEEKENGKYLATFMISGGKNGSGKWTDYLSQLTDVFKALKEKTGTEPLLYKLDTDICDDVWTGYVFLYDHNDAVKESLNEAVDYYDQIPKMAALNNGTRGFNAKAASDEKLKVNRKVCIDYNYGIALKVIEDEMIRRGLLQPAPTVKQNLNPDKKAYDPDIKALDFQPTDIFFIWEHKDNLDLIIESLTVATAPQTLFNLIIYLILAVYLKEYSVIEGLKNWIIKEYNMTSAELKEIILKKVLENKEIHNRIIDCINTALEERKK